MKLKVYTDGGARGNPGNAGIGVFITDENGKEIEKRYKNLGIKTNNESEYLAAFYGIQRAIELKATQIEFYADSNLLINQLSGKWKIKKEELKKIYFEILGLLNESKVKINYFWISRENNKEADRLSNVAMNEVIKSKKNINFIT